MPTSKDEFERKAVDNRVPLDDGDIPDYGHPPSQPQTPSKHSPSKLPSSNGSSINSPLNITSNLQQQFQEVTKEQEIIQRRYKELWSWHGTKTETSEFHDYQMEGYLRKYVDKVHLF